MRRVGRTARGAAAVISGSIQRQEYSDSRVKSISSEPPKDHWGPPGAPPRQLNSKTGHPLLRMRKTAIEWRVQHGHGGGHINTVGPTREIADFEYADGTPAPISRRRYAYKHHQDSLLVQLFRAGALVERFASVGYLPRIPGVPEQRDWDPAIPLYLEDADEHGKPPMAHYTAAPVLEKHLNAKFETKTSPKLVNEHNQESLEPNTMFATYDPSAFISEPIVMRKAQPIWSRRRWALSNEFLVPKAPQPKNTIKDE